MTIFLVYFLISIAIYQVIKFLISASKVVWRYYQGNKQTRQAIWLLARIYKPWAVCLKEVVEYSPEKKFLRAKMHAPKDYSYTWFRPECVTGIHYDLALSELAYVFIQLLINSGTSTLITEEEFNFLKKIASQVIELKKIFQEEKGRLWNNRFDRKAHRQMKENLVKIRSQLKATQEQLSLLLWKTAAEVEETFFQKFDWPSRYVVKIVYRAKLWLEGMFWRPFAPQNILRLTLQEFEQVLFERLMEKYKLVFLSKEIFYIKRTILTEDFEIFLELKKQKRTEQGFPLSLVGVDGGSMKGIVRNVALLNEIKVQS